MSEEDGFPKCFEIGVIVEYQLFYLYIDLFK